MLQESFQSFSDKTTLNALSTITKNHAYWQWRMFDSTWRAKRFSHIAAGILAAAALGIAAAGFGGSSIAYATEEPCLGVVGETVEEEVSFLNLLLGDTGAAVEQEVNFVLDTVHDPIGAVDEDLETVQGDIESVQACLS
jgi:hypothetical protein